MTCPQCGHKQECGCPPCHARNPVEKPYRHVGNGDIACGACGHTLNINEWEALAVADYKRWKKENAKV